MENEIEKKNNKPIFLVIIGVLLIVIIVLVFLLLTKDNKKIEKENNNSNINDSNTNTNEKIEESDKLDEETEKLMLLFPAIETAYQNKLLKVTDLAIEDIYANTMFAIGYYYKDGLYYLDFDSSDEESSNGCKKGTLAFKDGEDSICYTSDKSKEAQEQFAVDEKTFEKALKQFYGDSIKYQRMNDVFGSHKNFTDYHYQNGYYYGYGGGGGYGFGDGAEFHSQAFHKVETKGDEKYIYVDYAYTVYHCQDEDCKKGTISYYKDSSKKEKVFETTYDDSINILESASLASGKVPLYKHTYKKNSDGSYYWYSVEPVK